jgi:hypothetical protein
MIKIEYPTIQRLPVQSAAEGLEKIRARKCGGMVRKNVFVSQFPPYETDDSSRQAQDNPYQVY